VIGDGSGKAPSAPGEHARAEGAVTGAPPRRGWSPAERIRARLAELTREIAEAEAGDVQIDVALGFYRPRA
jgi:hypothetical protein